MSEEIQEPQPSTVYLERVLHMLQDVQIVCPEAVQAIEALLAAFRRTVFLEDLPGSKLPTLPLVQDDRLRFKEYLAREREAIIKTLAENLAAERAFSQQHPISNSTS